MCIRDSVYSLDNDNGSRSGILVETAANNDLGNPLRNTLANGGGVVLPGVKADGIPNDKRIDVSDAQLLGNKIPFGSTNGLTAKSYVYDASYVKIRELALSYRSVSYTHLDVYKRQVLSEVSNLWC